MAAQSTTLTTSAASGTSSGFGWSITGSGGLVVILNDSSDATYISQVFDGSTYTIDDWTDVPSDFDSTTSLTINVRTIDAFGTDIDLLVSSSIDSFASSTTITTTTSWVDYTATNTAWDDATQSQLDALEIAVELNGGGKGETCRVSELNATLAYDDGVAAATPSTEPDCDAVRVFDDSDLLAQSYVTATEPVTSWEEWKTKYKRIIVAGQREPRILNECWEFQGITYPALTFGDIT